MRPLLALLVLCGCPKAVPVEPDAGPDAGSEPDAGVDAGLPDDVRSTRGGLVRGAHVGASLVFKGIPYAAPPERWKPPQPAAAWSGTRDALVFGPQCVQVDPANDVVGDEDCLSLNVWAPFAVPSAALPVMVFVHGGNNQTGCSCDLSGTTALYDGQYLAEHGPAVVVTINYRVAAFGFLADPAFAAENSAGSTGNYALRDQLLALQWVKENVAGFSGDPARVMLFGQSAGSNNTAALVASPKGAGLFSRAVQHSGAGLVMPLATVHRTWMAAERSLGCDTGTMASRAACMRAKPKEAIARVPGAAFDAPNPDGAQYNPSVDGDVLPSSPLLLERAGLHNKVSMMIGTTADEYTQLVDYIASMPITSDAVYQSEVRLLFGTALGDAALAQYPAAGYPTPRDAYIAILNDLYEVCPSRLDARALASSAGQPPLYRFIYSHTFHNGLATYRAAHGFDLLSLMHVPLVLTGGGDDVLLADAMARYWARFAATGNPNGGSDPAWSAYDAGADSYLSFDWPITSGAGARAAQCDFWETQGL